MSDFDPTVPKSIVLRVEITAEQAASLGPLLGATGSEPAPAPMTEQQSDVRVIELKQRESDLDQREAEFEADVMFREDRIERWRTELEELERTLERRERDLVSYVDQLQGAMTGTSGDAWWSRPAGGDGGVR